MRWLRVVAALSLLAGLHAAPASRGGLGAQALAQSVTMNPHALVFIQLECVDALGIPSEPTGSGFIIEKSGYVATAHHVVRCWDQKARSSYRPKKIVARLGGPSEPERPMDLIKSNEDDDIAILKLRGAPRTYPTLQVCSLRNPKPGVEFRAGGFPEGSELQLVQVIFGNASGKFWMVAAPFAHGMSGGPVANQNGVIGLVKGGRQDVQAIRQMIPIHLAGNMIKEATGIELRDCGIGGHASGEAPVPSPHPTASSEGHERVEAIKSAQRIMRLFSEQRYREVWMSSASEFIRQRSTEDNFLAHLAMGRAQLGPASNSRIIDVQFSMEDPSSGFKGSICSVTFASTYAVGQVYDRIVVVKDPDGHFRLSGFWATPGLR